MIAEKPPLARRGTVLVVDDEEGVRASVRVILEETCDVLEAQNGAEALDVLRTHEIDLVMLDQRMPGEPGIDILPRVKALDPTTVVVLVTAVREVRTAVEALKRGAYDYVTKPFDVDDILLLAQRALEKRALEREVLCLRSALAGNTPEPGSGPGFDGLVGRHPEMVKIYQLITQIADTPTTVLIMGESGTGKELVARAIHNRSERRGQPFVAVNVAAIPDTLIESELFGHEKGAFTAPTPGSSASSSWPTAARSSSTRSARYAWTSRRSFSGRSRSARSSASAGSGPSRSTCAWLRRPTSTSRARCGRASSARTSTTA